MMIVDERSLFIVLQRKGSFDTRIKGLNMMLSLALEKDQDKVVIKPGNEQKISIDGFSLEFSKDVQNADVLNRLSNTFKDQMTAALTASLEKKMTSVMAQTAKDLNDLLAIGIKFLKARLSKENSVTTTIDQTQDTLQT